MGLNAGTIRNSYAAVGTVNSGNGANDRAGGLVGLNLNTGTIRNSYSTGNIDGAGGYDYGGGLVGEYRGSNIDTHTQRSYRNSGISISNINVQNAIGISRSVTQLQAGTNIAPDNSPSCLAAGGTFADGVCTGGHYDDWSTNDWVFGTSSQYPALRSYKTDGSQGDLLCGQPSPRSQCPP